MFPVVNCVLIYFFFFNVAVVKFQMERFTKKIVDMMKAERLFQSQGGPIILSQVDDLCSYPFAQSIHLFIFSCSFFNLKIVIALLLKINWRYI